MGGAHNSSIFNKASSTSKYLFNSSRSSTGNNSRAERNYLRTQFSDGSKPQSRGSNNFHPGFLNLDQIKKQQKKEHKKQVAEKYIKIMRNAIDNKQNEPKDQLY